MIDGNISLVINTPSGKRPKQDEISIRINAMTRDIPLITTVRAAKAFTKGIGALQKGETGVTPLQDYHG
jgi:carbamoyl-phosphate synthase large subunit